VLTITDNERVRVIMLDRPEALNAFNEDLYDATADSLAEASAARDVAVVVLTGRGRAFSAGTDVIEMAARTSDPDRFRPGQHGFRGLIDQLVAFPKPLLCAVNGLALGIGVTILGFAELVVMSREAKVRCPFSDLAVAPEAASSYLLPLLLGRQQASWMLLSSEWFSAAECEAMGLAWRVTAPEDLMPETLRLARHLATKPIASLVEIKRTITAPHRDAVAAARGREDQAFARLLGRPANMEAFVALSERRSPNFAAVDAANPVNVVEHWAD
jgi:enoyl-CoA hydratase/carnithine racemase